MSESDKTSLHFAANLRLLRKMKGMTQKSLSEALEIKRSAVSTYESGFTEPRLQMLQKMADYFEVSLAHLISSAPVATGLDQMVADDESLKGDGIFINHLKDFLNATTETQKMYEGIVEFDALANKSTANDSENYEANRLKIILKEILDNNWSILRDIQMLEE